MDSREAAEPWGAQNSFAAPGGTVVVLPAPSAVLPAVAWAGVASTLYRIRRGEGALLAVNLSLLAHRGLGDAQALAGALLSVLAIGLMYAFNDLYDAPTDWSNPKKDRALISTYLEHRYVCSLWISVLSLVTVGFALATLGARAAVAVAGAMLVNIAYSTLLKGVPVIDVAWCGLWGVLYAAIVTASPWPLGLIGLMTAVCHLYQALDDKVPDAANGIITTAVRSPRLSRDVLIGLSLLLFVGLRPSLGDAWALTAFTPLAIFFTVDEPRTGWLLTKVYFGVLWLHLLEIARATG